MKTEEAKTEEKKKKTEEKKSSEWLVLGSGTLIIVLILTIAAYFRFSTLAEKHLAKQPLVEARVAETETKIETEFPKIVTVGTEWKRIKLPYCSWFDISPMDGNLEAVKIKLANNKEFTLFPNGELFYKGEKVPDFGKIPGVDIDIRATETSAKVIVSAGKKL